MYVTDFLSRHPDNDTDSPNEIIPIAFLLNDVTKQWDEGNLQHTRKQKVIHSHICNKCENHKKDDYFCIMTRSMAKQQEADVPAMYPLRGDHKKVTNWYYKNSRYCKSYKTTGI